MIAVDDNAVSMTSDITPTMMAADGFDIARATKNRPTPKIVTKNVDKTLHSGDRSKAIGTTRDVVNNFSVAQWCVDKHLDYVTHFEFHSRTKDRGWDSHLEQLMAERMRPNSCDIAGRHPFRGLIRMTEGRAVIDGDFGLLQIRDGRLQGVAGPRIKNPRGVDVDVKGKWIHGVRKNRVGRHMEYAVHRWAAHGSGMEFERFVPARNLILHGYVADVDQTRGISPFWRAVNPLLDVQQGFNLALAKMKVHQLFALALFRQSEEGEGTEDANGDSVVDLSSGEGMLDMEPDDKVEMLESKHPSTEMQAFTEQVVMAALKSLDIPYSFYREDFTNFFGSRAAWLHYERSCLFKRLRLIDLLKQLTVWWIRLWIQSRELTLPRGTTVRDLQYEWVPKGMPWWDPSKEMKGDIAAIQAGLSTPQRISRQRDGGDWYDNIDEIKEAMLYAKDKGVPLNWIMPGLGSGEQLQQAGQGVLAERITSIEDTLTALADHFKLAV